MLWELKAICSNNWSQLLFLLLTLHPPLNFPLTHTALFSSIRFLPIFLLLFLLCSPSSLVDWLQLLELSSASFILWIISSIYHSPLSWILFKEVQSGIKELFGWETRRGENFVSICLLIIFILENYIYILRDSLNLDPYAACLSHVRYACS